MQVLENEIRGKQVSLRRQGVRGEYLIKFPAAIADSLGLKVGDRFEQFFNHKGEVMFRPVSANQPGTVQLPGAGVAALLPDHEEALG